MTKNDTATSIIILVIGIVGVCAIVALVYMGLRFRFSERTSPTDSLTTEINLDVGPGVTNTPPDPSSQWR